MDERPENLRSITHDMRNLLTAVRGHAELALRAMPDDAPTREDVANIVVVTAAVFELVDQIDGPRRAELAVATNLDTTVAGMRRLLDGLLPSGIELEMAPGASGVGVSVPKLRIERIVLNLAINARDAMGTEGKLTVATGTDVRGRALIVVRDTGPGFTDDALDHLFESGYTTKRDRGGSGHGLYALKGIVDDAGGSIAIDSTPGRGATVTIRLPIAPPTSVDEAPTSGADDVVADPTDAATTAEAGGTAEASGADDEGQRDAVASDSKADGSESHTADPPPDEPAGLMGATEPAPAPAPAATATDAEPPAWPEADLQARRERAAEG